MLGTVAVRPTHVAIDLAAVALNLRTLRAIAAPAELFAIVKADAYGHGAVAVARAIEQSGGATLLAVSLTEEGFELREHGITGEILILGGYYGRQHDEIVRQRLQAVCCTAEDVSAFADSARRLNVRAQIQLKVDTGMSRLGVSDGGDLDRLLALVTTHPELELTGVLTHFASADLPDISVTQQQIARFHGAISRVKAHGLSPRWFHAANSAALLRFPEARFDAVRPGIALYGISPSNQTCNTPGLKQVMKLATNVIALRDLPVGARVSYEGLFCTTRPSRIAVLPVGYADGYSRRLSNVAEVLLRGRRVKIAGVVCMDMVMCDVTDLPDVALGDEAVLIGSQGDQSISVHEVAAWAGLSPYEIPCMISKRVPRRYVDSAQ